MMSSVFTVSYLFFFNDTATTEIYTLSLHDALPILRDKVERRARRVAQERDREQGPDDAAVLVDVPLLHLVRLDLDRKSTRLNSSHANISYAVFCLKKKKYHFCCIFLISFIIQIHPR